MKRGYFIISIILFLFVISSCNIIKKNLCSAAFVTGRVHLITKEHAIIEQIHAGDKFKENDIIRTDFDSTIVISFFDGAMIKLNEESRLKITELSEESSQLGLEEGLIYAKPYHESSRPLTIKTKRITVRSKGTEYLVNVDENNFTEVIVNEGSVIVTQKLDDNSIKRIRQIDEKLADEIEKTVNLEIELTKEEKIEIDHEKYEQSKKEMLSQLEELVNELEKNKGSKKKLENTILNAMNKSVKNLDKETKKILKKEKIKNWKDIYEKDEFKELKIMNEKIKKNSNEDKKEKKKEKGKIKQEDKEEKKEKQIKEEKVKKEFKKEIIEEDIENDEETNNKKDSKKDKDKEKNDKKKK